MNIRTVPNCFQSAQNVRDTDELQAAALQPDTGTLWAAAGEGHHPPQGRPPQEQEAPEGVQLPAETTQLRSWHFCTAGGG